MSNYKGVFVPKAENNPWNLVFDLVKDGSTVLDVGCSWGSFGSALIDRKRCIVDGIEPDLEDYKKATHLLRRVANTFADEALSSTFVDQKYDNVVFLDVIEHLYDPVATLQLVKKHLNKDGSIIFSIPNMAHISVRLMLLNGDFDYGETGLLDKTHLHFYTLKEIERIFAEAGYKIKTLNYTEATYPPGLIDDQLKSLGINKSKKLDELLNSEDARVFEYVGEAVVAKSSKIPRERFSPDPQGTISLWYQGHLKERDKNIRSLQAIIADQKKQFAEQTKSIQHYEQLVNSITKSKAYKLGQSIATPYRKISGLKNRGVDEE